MRRRFALSLVLALLAAVVGRGAGAEPDATRVVVVANADDPDSMALASFYVAQRRIPDANIITLSLPRTETITWDVFESRLLHPLRQRLVTGHWVEGTLGPASDSDGHATRPVAVSGHRMAYLVLCRGVPLRIAHDPARLSEAFKTGNPRETHTNQASVDSELALLAARNDLRHINGAARNPLFDVAQPSKALLQAVVRVMRLDGPDLAACERLVLSAIAAEEHGLAGRAYVDRGGPHAAGDAWLAEAATLLRQRDFDVVQEDTPAVFGDAVRFDAPAVYLGWYTANPKGALAQSGFQFPAGAVALHIYSFSAESLRFPEKNWSAFFVTRGVAATVGNVYEPYLPLTHRPEKLVTALLEGRTWGEAAYRALPVLSWQAVAIGDPLYRPFARSLAQQVTGLKDRADAGAQYVALRETNFLLRTSRREDAVAWLARAAREHPGLALSLRLAQERRQDGDLDAARRALAPFQNLGRLRVDEIGVVAEAAALLAELQDPGAAVQVYQALLGDPAVNPSWRRALLPVAVAAATAAEVPGLRRQWSEELAALK